VTLALVGVAAAVGSVLRCVVSLWVQRAWGAAFPLGTLVVNVSGSFAFGLLIGLALHHGVNHSVVTVLGAGFLGGYTTFSTWAWESFSLRADREVLVMAANVGLSVVGGLLAAAAGLALGGL
jgi:CrcB protein